MNLHPVPEAFLTSVCKIGKGRECCRYLVAGAGGMECAKLQKTLKLQIDRSVAVGVFTAQGDNCEGL